jgi:hypothetical protein
MGFSMASGVHHSQRPKRVIVAGFIKSFRLKYITNDISKMILIAPFTPRVITLRK